MPNARSCEHLKRVGRYRWPACTDNVLDVYVDTYVSGCIVTRKSTSGGMIMNGGHCLKHYSTAQSTIALSSGEAELHGISKELSHALGIQALARDLGLYYEVASIRTPRRLLAKPDAEALGGSGI